MSQPAKRVLIVDDEPDIRELLAFSFRASGFQVFTAENGRKGYDVAVAEAVDLVVTDIQMPGGDGIELLNRLKERSSEVPVVLFITGFSEISLEEAYDKGAEALFPKPFNTATLLKVARESIRSKEDRWSSRHSRTQAELPVKLGSRGHDPAAGKLVNIGRGGVFIALRDADLPEVNTVVELDIEFVHDDRATVIHGLGKVRWIRPETAGNLPSGCGIEFLELSDATRGEIIELINYIRTRQYIPRS